MTNSTLPFTVQDDIKQKEKYAEQQRTNTTTNGRGCSSRRMRTLVILILIFTCSLLLVKYYGEDYKYFTTSTEMDAVNEAAPIQPLQPKEESFLKEISLKDEILQDINQNQLIVFSKTYCPFSKKAKSLFGLYELKKPLKVIEVDLRSDDYDVKMVLKDISGRATFPNIFLNGQSLGGSDDLEVLHSTGELRVLLKENNLLI